MNNYIERSPRPIGGKVWVIGFIKRKVDGKENEAFEFFCSKLRRKLNEGKNINIAAKETEKRFKIPIVVEECPKSHFPKNKPAFKIYVG